MLFLLPLFFQKRGQIYNLLILEDAFAESLVWNTVAGELAEGLEQRAIPVTFGRFVGMADFILVLQINAGLARPGPVNLKAEINGNGKIGTEEAVYCLQVIAGIK